MKKYPFKFLDAYNKNDSDIFFGRNEEVDALYEMIFQNAILLVYGGSGTGKTSLIQCGLASRFKSYDWLPLIIRRGSNINESLAKILAEASGDADEQNEAISLASAPGNNDIPAMVKDVYDHHFKPVYLIFDQFEELYILGSKLEQEEFISTIKQIFSTGQHVKLIFSIREEYLGHLFEFERAVPQLLRKKLRVEPMTIDKLSQILEGINAFKNCNVKFEADEIPLLQEGMITRLNGTKKTLTLQLPYLQVFLDKLYLTVTNDETRTTEALITNKALESMGDIGDVLRDFLEDQVNSISLQKSKPGEEVTTDRIWKILSLFVTLEGTKEPTRLKDLHNRLNEADEKLVDECVPEFVNRRIMKYAEATDQYELAHDSLAKSIAEKRTDEDIALLEIRRLISNQVSVKSDVRETFSEKQLKIIAPYLEKIELSADEKKLIDDSHNAVKKQKYSLQKRKVAIGAGIAIGIAMIVTAVLLVNRHNEQQQEKEARSNSLAGFKELARKAYLKENKLQGYHYIIQALSMEENVAVKDSLVKYVQQRKRMPLFTLNEMMLHNAGVANAIFGEGDSTILTWTNEGLLSEWNVRTGLLVRKVKHKTENLDEPFSELVNSNNTFIFSLPGSNNTAVKDTTFFDSSIYFKKEFATKIYEPDITGLPQFPQIVMRINGAYFSQDRTLLLTWGNNTESIFNGVDLWNGEGLNQGPSLMHDGINGAVLSRDNKMLLTWGTDSTARIWKNSGFDTSILRLPPKLINLKAEIETGAQVSPSDQTIRFIYPAEYLKKKKDFEEELRQLQLGKK